MSRVDISFVKISLTNIHLLEVFINNLGDSASTFRYYQKRDISVIEKHLVTLMIQGENRKPIAYGHLENENGTTWLGVCVLPNYKGQGFGSLMLERLIEKAKENKIDKIDLTVDKVNVEAVRLYEKFKFIKVSENEKIFQYRLFLIA
ncbi:MAG: GNAT family N-acetyltransferase [Bacteroidetes bacterium]|nr:GNAT family N-acetyltransferase [Bacteroidota bacterium]